MGMPLMYTNDHDRMLLLSIAEAVLPMCGVVLLGVHVTMLRGLGQLRSSVLFATHRLHFISCTMDTRPTRIPVLLSQFCSYDECAVFRSTQTSSLQSNFHRHIICRGGCNATFICRFQIYLIYRPPVRDVPAKLIPRSSGSSGENSHIVTF